MVFSRVISLSVRGNVLKIEVCCSQKFQYWSSSGHFSIRKENYFRHPRYFSSSQASFKTLTFDKKSQRSDLSVYLKNVKKLPKEKTIEIEFMESGKKLFPFVWLRDHCQCDKCFHPISRSKTMLFDDLDLNVEPTLITVEYDSVLSIEWSDGHTSRYNAAWLHDRGFEPLNKNKRPSAYGLKKVYWGSEILQNLPMANFQELMSEDSALLTWLQQLETFGFVLINNAPAEYGQVRKLVERVAFLKKTHYGAEFSVKAKPDPSNVAYSSGTLQLHTDLPYYEYKPGLQLIHCIVQFEGEGAESRIADAAHVALELKKARPEMFRILSETNVDFCDIGTDEGREFFKILQQPVIRLDVEGNISRINFSHPQRDSFFNVDHGTVFKWYKAMKAFHTMLQSPQYCLQFKMIPGTIQSFDNLRIVHGRRSYDERRGSREIEGCYMDWDEARSKRRVLERKLGAYVDSSSEEGKVSKAN